MTTTNLSNLIEYRCTQPKHLGSSTLDRVFVYEDSWAYCPAGRAAGDHHFVPTGGLERRRLEGGMTVTAHRTGEGG